MLSLRRQYRVFGPAALLQTIVLLCSSPPSTTGGEGEVQGQQLVGGVGCITSTTHQIALSGLLLQETGAGEAWLHILPPCKLLYLNWSVRIFFLRSVWSKTFQRAPCLWPSYNPPWTRPRTTRSGSDLWSRLKTIMGESRLNGAIPWTGPRMKVNMAKHSDSSDFLLFIGFIREWKGNIISCWLW